jgi:hypothetical protein
MKRLTLRCANKIMKKRVGNARRTGAATAFIDARLAAGRVAFPLADLVRETGLSVIAAKNQLLRLGSQIVRVSRPQQFFLIVSPEHRIVGAPPVAWWLDDYFNWLRHPYYLALQSAASAYGSNPQALQVTQVVTDVPRRGIETGRLRVRFFVKRGIDRTPTQAPPNAFAPISVSTPEATAFDLIRYASGIGGIGRAVETLVPLLSLMRAPELKQVLNTENETATAQRLGYVFEMAGKKALAKVIHDWLPSQLALVPLAPSKAGQAAAPVIGHWRIVNNAGDFMP